jgi:hypothetical protein
MPGPCGIAQRSQAWMRSTASQWCLRVEPTPIEPTWMSHFGSRSHHFEAVWKDVSMGSQGECFPPFALAEVDDVTRERPNTSHPVQPMRASY